MGHLSGSDLVSAVSNRLPPFDAAAEPAPFAELSPNRQRIAIRDLHPTQMTVGYREIVERRRRWRAALAKGEDPFRSLIIPVVLGPGSRSYILDGHHGLCALAAEGVADVRVCTVADLGALEWVGFWRMLDRRGWCRPRDGDGQRQDYSYIPTTIDGLADDPYRSLARALRRAGGYAKKNTPFSDFAWADFLRSRVPRNLIDGDFEAAVRKASALAEEHGTLVTTAQGLCPVHSCAAGLFHRAKPE